MQLLMSFISFIPVIVLLIHASASFKVLNVVFTGHEGYRLNLEHSSIGYLNIRMLCRMFVGKG